MGQVIPDFSDTQINAVQQLINARYQEDTELQLADSEVQIDPQADETTACPILFWNARECNFVILKTGDDQYRAQFFYNPHDQYSTHQVFFTTVEDCVAAILREQSDYAREVEGVSSDASAADIN